MDGAITVAKMEAPDCLEGIEATLGNLFFFSGFEHRLFSHLITAH